MSYAFQLATAQGPLCSEPLQGVAVFLEQFETTATSDETSTETSGRLAGEVLRTVRDSIRQGFLDWSPRMLLAMYKCEIQASSKCCIMLILIFRLTIYSGSARARLRSGCSSTRKDRC